ncbi:MAG TPA: hypothetical protein DD723_09160 [Candidatus Omnitrophica bacterium]|nr:MAG: hypothetical protein A2Z81_08760 [Omnitrophica WOR_2 bacterium GWA2_45_18]OGX18987.1 MAG: hypothetical protein A2Y04_04735 [Omnitrophica WOR_2 bacterium GWC2_45_7]HBR15685.1 hypothetical protein [Candidatus Omnitrophota bacterium]
MPKVSVIIPTYNRSDFIGRAIESVLKQTFQDYEIIIVDDGSTDETREIVLWLSKVNDKIKYFYQPNKGVSAARNRGLEEAKGEFIAFLDSDDSWAPEKLALQVKILEEHPRVGIVYAIMPMVDEKGESLGATQEHSGNNFKDLIVKGGHYPTSAVITRKASFQKAGLFDEAMPILEDIDMWLRIARFYDVHEMRGVTLAYYHRLTGTASRDKVKLFECQVMFYRKILKSYDDIPRRIVEKKLAKFLYLLAQANEERGQYAQALKSFREAISLYPLVGTFFFWEKDGIIKKALKSFRPFASLTWCYFKYVRTAKKHSNLENNNCIKGRMKI